jgi:hypothetical protein
MWWQKKDSRILGKLTVGNVPRCSHNNAKTLGFKHLQFPDMGASGGPTDRARVVHYWTDELLIRHDPVSDGETILPV